MMTHIPRTALEPSDGANWGSSLSEPHSQCSVTTVTGMVRPFGGSLEASTCKAICN